MKKKPFISILSILLSVVMVFCSVIGSSAFNGSVTYQSKTGKYTTTKISHPDKALGETDGIVDYVGDGAFVAKDNGQGDRGQNYAWAAVAKGDCVYVSTNYNSLGLTLNFMDTVLGHDFKAQEMTAQLDVMFNGAFYTGEPDGANTGGALVKINVHTNEVKILMGKSVDGNSVQLRNACEYKDKFYFCGSVNGLPKIIQVDPATDECKIVYEGMTPGEYYAAYLEGICTGIRGLCEYDGRLVVSCVTMQGPQILISDHPWDGQDAFTEIANQEALFNYPGYHFPDSIYGGSIWEMVDYNDTLYVSICTGTPENKPDDYSMQSFALVKGVENADGTWDWIPVIGDKADGAKYTFGIDPERTRAGAGVLQIHDGYLYIGEYNDEEIPLEEILFDMDFTFMNRNLEQSVNLYRMDKDENIELIVGDATEMFPEGGLSGIGSGFGRNENQYIWRMTSYNGKLYVGTMDTSSLLQPVGQFVNGDLLSMSMDEWKQLIGYIKTFADLKLNSEEADDGSNLSAIAKLLNKFSVAELAAKLFGKTADTVGEGESAETALSLKKLWKAASGMAECWTYLSTATRGFDLYVSDDGINFETITLDGFGDPYNHGCRVFANMDDGLAIGTANPFYAAQIWMLTDDESIPSNNNTVNEIKDSSADSSTGSILSKLLNKFFTFINKIIEMIKQLFGLIK